MFFFVVDYVKKNVFLNIVEWYSKRRLIGSLEILFFLLIRITELFGYSKPRLIGSLGILFFVVDPNNRIIWLQ